MLSWKKKNQTPWLNTLEFVFKSYYLFALKNILATLLSSPRGFEELKLNLMYNQFLFFFHSSFHPGLDAAIVVSQIFGLGAESDPLKWSDRATTLRDDANEISKLLPYLVSYKQFPNTFEEVLTIEIHDFWASSKTTFQSSVPVAVFKLFFMNVEGTL